MSENTCIHCGEPLKEDAKFCAVCGASLTQPQSTPPQPPPQQPQSTLPQSPPHQPQNIPAKPPYQPQNIPVQPPPAQYRQQPYTMQPQQQYPQNAPYYQGAPAGPKKNRRMSPVLIVLIIVVAAAIVFVTTFFLVRNLLAKTNEADYYEIGTDRVPSIKLVLGGSESRKMTGTSVNVTIGTSTKTYSYEDEGSTDGMELYEYAMYLQANGFSFLTDGNFSGSTGTAIQMGRNSDESGYAIVIQFDWKPGQYTVTLTRSQGSIDVYEELTDAQRAPQRVVVDL